MPWAVTNLLGLAVLSYLTERPMHAYELNRTLQDRDAARTFKLSYGALYGVVRQLAGAPATGPASRSGYCAVSWPPPTPTWRGWSRSSRPAA